MGIKMELRDTYNQNTGRCKKMSKTEKLAVLFGLTLNVVVVGLIMFASTNYVA